MTWWQLALLVWLVLVPATLVTGLVLLSRRR
jgi:hypothetical protein